MVRLGLAALVFGCLGAVACSSNNGTVFDTGLDSGTPIDQDGTAPINNDAGNVGIKDGASGNVDAGVSVIYAHTDTELYTMDPATQVVTDVGAFDDGSGKLPNVTDLAVNSAGEVWVNTETALYKATVPSTPGTVKVTKVADIKVGSTQKFFALGFAPAGVLGMGETLVAGDSLGVLYAVDAQGNLTELGAFGTDGNGGTYELSGDVVFYTQNGKPRGLATVRLFKKGTATPNNDILAEIDVAAMTTAFNTKTPAASLKKQFIGTGTTYGKLFGVGAWNDAVYAFERVGSGADASPARLIKVDSSGLGTKLQDFPNITAGWSGAGVTTAASVTILPPN